MNCQFSMNFLSFCVPIMIVLSLKIRRKVEGVFQVQKLDVKKEICRYTRSFNFIFKEVEGMLIYIQIGLIFGWYTIVNMYLLGYENNKMPFV